MKKLIGLIFSLISLLGYSSDSPEYPEVFQREYIYTNYQAFDKIQTYGLNTCIAIIIYNPELRDGVLAHFDARTKLTEIDVILKNFSNFSALNIELYGGVANENNLLLKIKKRFTQLGLNISRIKQNKDSSRSMAVMLELKSGIVTEYTEIYPHSDYQTSLAKFNRIKFGQKLFRHELSIGGGDLVQVANKPDFPFTF
jgi:hypothetical protein